MSGDSTKRLVPSGHEQFLPDLLEIVLHIVSVTLNS